jgi:hypothetical protein
MDTTSFNTAIQQFFRDVYNVEYISNFFVTYEFDGDLYRFVCKFQLNNVNKPIDISGQFATIEEFTTFAINELKERRFPIVDYFNLIHSEQSNSIV